MKKQEDRELVTEEEEKKDVCVLLGVEGTEREEEETEEV